MRVGSLFSGIGGIDLGLQWTGMEIVWQVEIDEWCRRVLARHFPDAVRYGDVREMHWERHHAVNGRRDRRCPNCLAPVDLICGGFPCQPVSHAGRRLGAEDERWLWPEFMRVIREVRPRWVLVENVPGLLSIDDGRLFGGVLRDLAEGGYDAEWDCIPAAALGAPHIRDRVFVVAHARSQRRQQESRGAYGDEGSDEGWPPTQANEPQCSREGRGAGDVADADHGSLFGPSVARQEYNPWATESAVGRVAHGVPARVDRLRGLGNAVVPQVAEYIGRLIMDAERRRVA
jgi:DNA (cytosine-5)-methyltransferase 1